MNNTFLQGTPLIIAWHFNKPDGAVFNLDGYELKLQYSAGHRYSDATGINVVGNTVSWAFPADRQKVSGEHNLKLYIFQNGKLFCKFIYDRAFTLYRCGSSSSPTTIASEDNQVVDLFTTAEFYLFQPIIPAVGNDGYWYVNGEHVLDSQGRWISAGHTVRFDEDTQHIIIDEGRTDENGDSIEQVITDVATALARWDDSYQTAESDRYESYAEAEAERNRLSSAAVSRANNAANDANEAAESANGAAAAANEAAESANGAAAAANEAAESADEAKNAANEASEAANEAAGAANSAAERANSAAAAAEHQVDVKRGYGIESVTQPVASQEPGGRNVVRVTTEDGRTFDFDIYNGRDSHGLYATSGDLMDALPAPVVGDYAFVGASFPAALYVCLEDGTWSNSGSTYGGPTGLEIVDNLTAGGSTKALSAEQGKVLEGKVSQLGQEVTDISHELYGGLSWVAGYIDSSGNLKPQDGYSQYTSMMIPSEKANGIAVSFPMTHAIRLAYYNGGTFVSRTGSLSSPVYINTTYNVRICILRGGGTSDTLEQMLSAYTFIGLDGVVKQMDDFSGGYTVLQTRSDSIFRFANALNRDGAVSSSNVWANIGSGGTHKLFYVKGIKKVELWANQSYAATICFVKTYVPPFYGGQVPDFCTGTTRISVPAGKNNVVQVPEDAVYAIVGTAFNSSQDATPEKLLFDGFDVFAGVVGEISRLHKESTIVVRDGTATLSSGVSRSLSIGDTIVVSEQTFRMTDSVLTNGAKGIFITCCAASDQYPWVVVDKDEKIVAVSQETMQTEMACYVNLRNIPGAYKLYYTMGNAESLCSVVYYDYDGKARTIYEGDNLSISASENLSALCNPNEKIYNAHFTNNGVDDIVTIEFSPVVARSIGWWMRVNSSEDVNKIKNINILTYYNGSQLLSVSKSSAQSVQINDWVFVKIPVKASGNVHYGDKIDKITIEVEFNDTETPESVVDMQLSELFVNNFERPTFIVNFDNQWKATEDCGAYDYLLDNKIPFTITGAFSDNTQSEANQISQAMVLKILAGYSKGIVDVGKYGGSGDGLNISAGMSFPDMVANAFSAIEAKESQGFKCVSFGSATNTTTSKLLRALECAGFKCIRGGMPGGMLSFKCRNEKVLIVSSYNNYYAIVGSNGTYFSHGISTNPSQESNPSMYDSYTDFLSVVEYALSESEKGGILLLNMRDFVEME